MPVYARSALRQSLGQSYVRDTLVAQTALSAPVGSLAVVMASKFADTSLSGQQLYERAIFRAGGNDYRVASFNAASGAWVSAQTVLSAWNNGADFEIHQKLSAEEKDRALDLAVARQRERREVTLPTVDGALEYSLNLNTVASPHIVRDVLRFYYLANPTGSLNKDPRSFPSTDYVQLLHTATGSVLRLADSLGASQVIALDCLVEPVLGSGDAATVSLPDDEVVLRYAEGHCWDLLIKDAPGQQEQQYVRRRSEAFRRYGTLAARFAPQVDRPLRLTGEAG